jgi:hypothetical protein
MSMNIMMSASIMIVVAIAITAVQSVLVVPSSRIIF